MAGKEIKRTAEQNAIISQVALSKNLKLKAYAGTGKTTTLLEIVKENSNKRFLLLAFNRSVKEEINKKKRKMGLKNLTVMTLHGLAYQLIYISGGRYNNGKPQLLVDRKSDIVQSILDNPALDYELSEIWEYLEAYDVSYLVSLFLMMLSSPYLPPWSIYQFKKQLAFHKDLQILHHIKKREHCRKSKSDNCLEEYEEKIVQTLNLLWQYTEEAIKNDREGIREGIKYTHEAYIKYAQKLIDKFDLLRNYDILLIDEAQDVNGVNIGIINAFKRQKIIVGDPHQNIYAFRGTINAFNYYRNWEELPLSTSFRFRNPQIVEYANVILQKVKDETTPLKMFESPEIEKNKDIAFLSRTNAGLIKVLSLLKAYEEGDGDLETIEQLYGKEFTKQFAKITKKGVKIKLLRSVNDIFDTVERMEKVLSAIASKKESKILKAIRENLPRYIAEFIENTEWARECLTDVDKFLELLDLFMEVEYKVAGIIIKQLGLSQISQIRQWVYEKVKKGEIKENGKGRGKNYITLSTIHTSKGLEWSYVVLIEDLKDPIEIISQYIVETERDVGKLLSPAYRANKIAETLAGIRNFEIEYNQLNEEINLIYVGITRAKERLIIDNPKLEKFLINGAKTQKEEFDKQFKKAIDDAIVTILKESE
jgi:superfamily I DNA/RNA helicase